MKIEIRLLQKEDDTSSFDCEENNLNLFFKQYAKQNQFKHYIGTTYVAVLDNKIIGYVSVSSSSIRVDALGELIVKKLPQYPLPILRLTRLAVDKAYQQKGIGQTLLKWVLKLTLKQKKQFGCFGLVVDAKAESVEFYEQYGFESFSIQAGALDVRPYAQSMFLSTKTIEVGMGLQ